jgi:hypothetical protein
VRVLLAFVLLILVNLAVSLLPRSEKIMFTYVHMDNLQLNLTEHSERHLPYFMITGSMNHARFGGNEKK